MGLSGEKVPPAVVPALAAWDAWAVMLVSCAPELLAESPPAGRPVLSAASAVGPPAIAAGFTCCLQHSVFRH